MKPFSLWRAMYFSLIWLVIAGSFFGVGDLWAQCDSSKQDIVLRPHVYAAPATTYPEQVQNQKSTSLDSLKKHSFLGEGYPQLTATKPFPGYEFSAQFDSSLATFLFTECRNNGKPLQLQHWRNGDVTIANNLSTISRTESFLLSKGDEIKFFRDMSWIGNGTRWFLKTENMITPRISNAHYYQAFGEVNWSVELIGEAMGQRLALLDSLTISQHDEPIQQPIIKSTNSKSRETVLFKVPETLQTQRVFIRLTLSATSNAQIIRKDKIMNGFSGFVTHQPTITRSGGRMRLLGVDKGDEGEYAIQSKLLQSLRTK